MGSACHTCVRRLSSARRSCSRASLNSLRAARNRDPLLSRRASLPRLGSGGKRSLSTLCTPATPSPPLPTPRNSSRRLLRMARLLLPCPLPPSSYHRKRTRQALLSISPLLLPATSSSWSSPRHTGPASSKTFPRQLSSLLLRSSCFSQSL
ncbi:hypothetical protein B0H12DRAFT_1156836, partial [Mycena haematopus]